MNNLNVAKIQLNGKPYKISDGTNNQIIMSQSSGALTIGSRNTFTWNDRLVLTAGDILKIAFTGNSADVWVSYIEQNWST